MFARRRMDIFGERLIKRGNTVGEVIVIEVITDTTVWGYYPLILLLYGVITVTDTIVVWGHTLRPVIVVASFGRPIFYSFFVFMGTCRYRELKPFRTVIVRES